MKRIDYHNIDQHLSKIQKVEASPYLLTRVQQKIKLELEEKISPVWAWSLAIPFLVFLVLNVSLYTSNNNLEPSSKSLIEELDLIDNNSLYN